jgi:hypothetical protein
MKQLLLAMIPLLIVATISNVSASGPRLDSDEEYSGVPGAGNCWVEGWDYGTAHIYDKTRAEICKDIPGDQFNAACLSSHIG